MLSVKIIGRSAGRSAVAAAAYRSGEKLWSKKEHRVHNYQNKKGVVYSKILLPEQAPSTFFNRSTLWNAVEEVEKNKNAQLAREVEVALPVELSLSEQSSLLTKYIQKNFVKQGMCADFIIHDKGDGNPHAHILLTMRAIDGEGHWKSKKTKEYLLDAQGQKQYNRQKKTYQCKTVPMTDWDQKEKILLWRENWAKEVNRVLETQGVSIDHRSYKDQGLDKIPTIHLGNRVCAMERKGISTDLGRIHRELVALGVRQEQQRDLGYREKHSVSKESQTLPFLTLSKSRAEEKLRTLYYAVAKGEESGTQLKRRIAQGERQQSKILHEGEEFSRMYKEYRICSDQVNEQEKILKEEQEKPFFSRNRSAIKSGTLKLDTMKQERKQWISQFQKKFGLSPVNNRAKIREKEDKYQQAYKEKKTQVYALKEQYQTKKKLVLKKKEEYRECLVYLPLREDAKALYEVLERDIEQSTLSQWNNAESEKTSILGQLAAFTEKEKTRIPKIPEEDYQRALKKLKQINPTQAERLEKHSARSENRQDIYLER